MNPSQALTQFLPRILTPAEMRAERDRLHAEGRTLVFTNGCFDILHRGHADYLAFARSQGDALVVGLNSDASVRRAKGPTRPVNPEQDLISQILPDVLVKGKDWAHYVSGRDIVEANGGRVVLAEMVEGRSTTATIERMRSS